MSRGEYQHIGTCGHRVGVGVMVGEGVYNDPGPPGSSIPIHFKSIVHF